VDSHDAVHGGGGIENGAKYAACSNGPLSHQNNFLFITAFLHISGCFSGPNRFFPKRYQSHFDMSTLCSNGSLSHQNNPIFFTVLLHSGLKWIFKGRFSGPSRYFPKK
jgi:hypothetical protein